MHDMANIGTSLPIVDSSGVRINDLMSILCSNQRFISVKALMQKIIGVNSSAESIKIPYS